MDKFLKLLLQKDKTVIIPDLGAIIVENEDTGDLSFNEYIKYNDGKLDQIIVDNSKMDTQEAQNFVAKHVKDLKIQLDKGESYDVFELGSFSKSSDGSITFKGNIKGVKAPEKKAAEPKKEEATSKKEEEKKEPTKSTDKASSEKSKKPEKSKEDTKKVATPSKETPKKEEKAPAKEKTVKPSKEDKIAAEKAKKAEKAKAAKSKADAKAEAKAKKLAKKKADKEAKLKNEKSKDPSKKKKKSFGVLFWVLMFILLVLCGGGVYVGMNYDKVKSYMGWDQFEEVDLTVEDTKEVDLDEAVMPDEEIDALDSESSDQADMIEEDNLEELDDEVAEEIEPVEEKVAPTPTPTVSSEGNIHLIAGTFTEKSNAESLVNDLQSKGHSAQIIGFYNNMHYVSVKSFSSLRDAKNGISSVESDAPGAWIFRQR